MTSKVAVVAGGTGAIGASIAARLQSIGYCVVAADRDVRPVPDGQTLHICDLTNPKEVEALFVHAASLGEIAVVVGAQGILRETPPGASNPEAVSAVIDVNLKSVAYLLDLCRRHLLPGASIVLISSWTSNTGRIRNGYAYQCTKAGVESLTHSFAVAYGPDGIRVNCIAPGFMADPMKGEGIELRNRQGGMDGVIQGSPLRRLTEAKDVADAAAFLCSDAASAITGIVLPVDTGYRAL